MACGFTKEFSLQNQVNLSFQWSLKARGTTPIEKTWKNNGSPRASNEHPMSIHEHLRSWNQLSHDRGSMGRLMRADALPAAKASNHPLLSPECWLDTEDGRVRDSGPLTRRKIEMGVIGIPKPMGLPHIKSVKPRWHFSDWEH